MNGAVEGFEPGPSRCGSSALASVLPRKWRLVQPRAVCADKDGHPRPADGSSAFSGSIETQKKRLINGSHYTHGQLRIRLSGIVRCIGIQSGQVSRGFAVYGTRDS